MISPNARTNSPLAMKMGTLKQMFQGVITE